MAFEIPFSCISVTAVVVIKQHLYNTVILWLLDWIQSKKLLVHYWIYLTSLGTALVALRNLGCFHQTRPVVGIGSQIAKVLGDAGVGRAALRGHHEIIFLDRSVKYLLKTMALLWELQIKPNTGVTTFSSFQLLIHLQKKIWLLMKTLFQRPWPRACGGRVRGRGNGSFGSWG